MQTENKYGKRKNKQTTNVKQTPTATAPAPDA
jgi:hypothetical protein